MKSDTLREARRWWSEFPGLTHDHVAVETLVAAGSARQLAPAEALVSEADKDATVFLVVSGSLRIVRHTRNGHEVWYADVKPGDLVGDMAALIGGRRPSSVIANGACSVLAIKQAAFLAVAHEHANFAVAMARMLASRLEATSKHLAAVVSLPVSTRLHGELAELGAQRLEDTEVFEIQPAPKVTALSHRIHATREATSRAFGELQQRGLLRRGKSSWTVIVPTEIRHS